MEICAFYFFWFGDIDKLTAGVPNPNYLKQKQKAPAYGRLRSIT
jgi:hypothetical protein